MDTNLTAPTKDEIKRTDRITGGYLLFASIRCTLQYVVLPFVLPFLGVSSAVSVVLSLIFDVVALGAITYNIFNLWNTNWRWRYIGLCAIMVPILGIFLYEDIRYLAGL